MKTMIVGLLALISLNLNAQNMNNPNEVVIGLFNSTDELDWQGVTNAFADKVTLDYGSMNGNAATELTPDQIVTAWKGILPGFESTHHQIGNLLSNIRGEKAKVFCYGTASHYLPDENGNLWLVVGTYDFELTKTDDSTWKISSMKFNYKYQDGNVALAQKAMNLAKEKP